MIENKEEMKKQIEKFKIKIYHELEHNTKEVLIFGNDNMASMCGEINHIMYKFASMIMKLSKQSEISENELLKVLKKIIKIYKKEYGDEE
jgi:siderophore synthetase component